MSETIKPGIFIPFSDADPSMVEEIINRLSKEGFHIKTDSNFKEEEDGWRKRLKEEIDKAEAIIIIVTPNTDSSIISKVEYVITNVRASSNTKVLVPVFSHVEEGSLTSHDIPEYLRDIGPISWYKENTSELVDEIIGRLNRHFQKEKKESVRHDQNPEPNEKTPVDELLNDISNDKKVNYWFLKMNPSVWPIEEFKVDQQTFMSTYYYQEKRPEYDLLKKVKPGDLVLGYAAGPYRSVVCIMEVTEPVGPDTAQGEIFKMKINKVLNPRVPIENFQDNKQQLVIRLEEEKKPPELFFELTKDDYNQILNSHVPDGTIFRNSYQPFYLTEGDHCNTLDQLDFENDIDSFASVIALKKVNPPLAIGLFGHWGSGKSFFIEKLYEKIGEKARSEDQDYVRNVVQVKFNSWHYSDSNLWASLITQIFDSLSRYPQEKDKEEEIKKTSEEIKKLSETLQFTSMQKEVMEEKKKELETRVDNLENEKRRKREELEDLSGIKLVKLIISDKKIKEDLQELNDENVENITQDFNKLNKYQDEIKNTGNKLNYYWQFLKNLKGWRWPLIILFMVFVFGTCYFIIPYLFPQEWNKLTLRASAIISVVVAFVGNALALIRPVMKNLQMAFQRLESMKQTLEARPPAVSPELEQKKAELTQIKASLEVLDQTIKTTRNEISEIVSGKRLLDFIEQRTRDENYTKQLGLISWIRKDFDKLDELLRKQHEVSEEDRKKILNPKDVQLRIDRIVLYIDDLDRCNEDIVVKVLEAIHLLLAFPLFVVVVGVDPRWLNNALSEKYKTLFGVGKRNGQKTNGKKDDAETYSIDETELFLSGAATSYDYLEKIFQIPFTLKPINKTGRENLIQYLIKDEMHKDEPKEPDTGIKQTEDTGNQKKKTPAPGVQALFDIYIEQDHKKKEEEIQKHKEMLEEEERRAKEIVVKQRLVFTMDELEYMKQLSPIFGHSPRAINRYINIYRIIKAHKGIKVIGDFSKEEFIPIMFILAVVVGHSVFAQDFINKIGEADNTQNLISFINTSGLNDKLVAAIISFIDNEIGGMPMKLFKINIGLISRFSFRTLLSEA
ncbi:MAG: P-loop NTPase fold protein [Flavisolibacter sp.]